MFRKKQQPQAISGDPVGEALVEVRERIELYGWKVGGAINDEYSPMCLGNHIAFVTDGSRAHWIWIETNQLGRALVHALGFDSIYSLYRWNDHLVAMPFENWRGKRATLRRINAAISAHNEAINMDIGKPIREIEAPAPVEIPLEEPEVEREKEVEREPEKVPA